jgi:hypothetical protein
LATIHRVAFTHSVAFSSVIGAILGSRFAIVARESFITDTAVFFVTFTTATANFIFFLEVTVWPYIRVQSTAVLGGKAFVTGTASDLVTITVVGTLIIGKVAVSIHIFAIVTIEPIEALTCLFHTIAVQITFFIAGTRGH